MNKKLLFIGCAFLLTALGILSCEDKWDEHYSRSESGETSVSSLNLYDYLREQPEYSRFMDFLDEQKVGDELKKNQELTVWVVSNDAMPADFDHYTEREKLRLAKHHINYMSLTSPKLSDGKTIKTMAGKNISFSSYGDGLALDLVPIVKENQVCANGVAHELNHLMIPRDNIYEVIAYAGDEYSIYRDSFLIKSDTVFDMENSFGIGVDEDGNTIYDSVFVIRNPYLEAGDFRDDNQAFTLFLPSNEVLLAGLDSIEQGFGDFFLPQDYQTIYEWILKATIHRGRITDYQPDQQLYSIWGDYYDWRTKHQLVVPTPKEGSNGLIYEMKQLYIPRSMFQSVITCNFVESYAAMSTADRAKYVKVENHTLFEPAWSNSGMWMRAERSMNDDVPVILEVTVMTTNRFGKPVPARFFPGEYDLQGIVRPYEVGKWDIYFNDEMFLPEHDPYSFNNANSDVMKTDVAIWKVTEATELRVKFVQNIYRSAVKAKRIPIRILKFTPKGESVY